jgi:pseudaminic acid cytidylyltransferase
VNKNIYELLGKPAIAYTILNAIDSGLFQKVFVSTNSPQIAAVAESFGATVNTLRNEILSGDYATTIEVISGFIKSDLDPENYPDYICCIYPVTPLLTLDRLKEGFNQVVKYPTDFIFAAVPAVSYPDRSFSLNEQNRPILKYFKEMNTRTQDLKKIFQDAGQFYWGTTKSWLNEKSILGNNCRAVKLDKYEVIDVDEIEDMKFVEMILKTKSECY